MLLPLLLRPARLTIHCRLPARPSRLALRPFAPLRRWNSTVATETARTLDPALDSDKGASAGADAGADKIQSILEEAVADSIDERIRNLPLEARTLLTRQYPLIQEFIAPSQSHLLTLTLQPYLKFNDIQQPDPEDTKAPHNPFTIKGMLPIYGQALPPGYHFAFFNGYTQEGDLSSDGYTSHQAPGGPWTRRMWAGGKLTFNPMPEKRNKGQDRGARRARPLDVGRRALCHETIEDIQMKGEPGSDKEMMFVYLRRKLWAEGYIVREPTKSPKLKDVEPEEEVDEKKILPDAEVPLIEQRCIVYMKEKPKPGPSENAQPKSEPEPEPTAISARSRAGKADFSHSLTPTTTLLFRYSALTFNAHKIHTDPEHTRNVEGHKKLLVHGPLTLTLLLELLRNHSLSLEKQYKLDSFEYRNITPLYVDEQMHLYGRLIPDAPDPVTEEEYDPRERLPMLYDRIDTLRKNLKALRDDEEIPEEEKTIKKKELRKELKTSVKESEKLEKFNPVERREVEYRTYELWVENDAGVVCMRGTALLEDLPAKVELTPEQQWKRYQSEMARNRRLLQKQQMKAHKDMVRARRRERKLKLRQAQKERETTRRAEKEMLWKEAREAMLAGVTVEEHRERKAAEDAGLPVEQWREMKRSEREQLNAFSRERGDGEFEEYYEDGEGNEEWDGEEGENEDEDWDDDDDEEDDDEDEGDEGEDEGEGYEGDNGDREGERNNRDERNYRNDRKPGGWGRR
ncbi:hypothetical protein DRE_02379 [Drechslerella stenobrocha 248]|uniref:MaoC-like domain-containing protein n=1 Tax=Drechslerella stenobrocha 248 TaxID=1043628 RepID=W7IGF8_9PEZI|nr:hypothetical protein DRE_02379 [Drechslerella stenobrocha 248]